MMAQPLRIEYPGALYHVTSRGNRQEAIFDDDRDRTAFLNVPGEVVSRFRWRCHAYCLTGNHYRLMLDTPEVNLTKRKCQEFVAGGMGAETIWRDLQRQIYLGDDDFVERMRGKLGGRDKDVNKPKVQQRGAVAKLSTLRRQYKKRDEASRAAYETGAYSYQPIAKDFGVHFTTVGRAVRHTARSARSGLVRK